MSQIGVFSIPQLVDWDDELMIVEMSIVSAPYILDFGKADLDVRTEYPAEVRHEEEEKLRNDFGSDSEQVRSAIFRLERYGIYYEDANPRNIKLS